MTVITIPKQEEFLLDLFMRVPNEGLVLQTAEGQCFMLSSMEGWQGFDVGPSDDFEQEVKATAENQDLVDFLSSRKDVKETVSLADIKQEFGLS